MAADGLRVHPLCIRMLVAGSSRQLLLERQTSRPIMNVDAATDGVGWLSGTKTAALVTLVSVGKPYRMASCTEDDGSESSEDEFKRIKRTFRKTFCKEIL